jgi:hypothetical protein
MSVDDCKSQKIARNVERCQRKFQVKRHPDIKKMLMECQYSLTTREIIEARLRYVH